MHKWIRFLLVLILLAVVLPTSPDQAVAQGDCDPDTDYFTMGVEAMDAGDYETAIAAFTCALELTPDPVDQAAIYSWRGDAYWYLDYIEEAYQDYTTGIELDPSNPEIWLARGILYHVSAEAYEEALADYEQALTIDPEYSDVYVWIGLLYQDSGDDETAIEYFDSALSLYPDDPYTRFYRGISLQFLDRDEEAIDDFTQALALDDTFGWAYTYRGISLQYLDRDEEAIEDFNRALEYDPDDALAYLSRGMSLSYLGDDESAMADFDEALARDPEDAFTLIQRALSNMWLDNIDAAWADLDRADSLDVDEEYPDIDLYRGILYQAAGDDEAALEAFYAYLDSYPDDAAFVLSLIGQSLFYLGRDDEALDALTQAIDRADPEYDTDVIADARFYRGVTYYYQGDYEAALEDLNGTAEYYEDDAWTYAYRSDVYYELGDTEAALADMQYAISLEPEEDYFLDMAEEIGFDPAELELDEDAGGSGEDAVGEEESQDEGAVEEESQDEGAAQEELQDESAVQGESPDEGAVQEESQDEGAVEESPDGSAGEEETGYLVPETGKPARLKPALRRQDARSVLRSRSDNSVRNRSRGEDRGSTRGSTRVLP